MKKKEKLEEIRKDVAKQIHENNGGVFSPGWYRNEKVEEHPFIRLIDILIEEFS